MKKTISRLLLCILTLSLLLSPVTALAAEPETETDPMEEAREFLTRVGEKVRSGRASALWPRRWTPRRSFPD